MGDDDGDGAVDDGKVRRDEGAFGQRRRGAAPRLGVLLRVRGGVRGRDRVRDTPSEGRADGEGQRDPRAEGVPERQQAAGPVPLAHFPRSKRGHLSGHHRHDAIRPGGAVRSHRRVRSLRGAQPTVAHLPRMATLAGGAPADPPARLSRRSRRRVQRSNRRPPLRHGGGRLEPSPRLRVASVHDRGRRRGRRAGPVLRQRGPC